jgi:hypothetical protein
MRAMRQAFRARPPALSSPAGGAPALQFPSRTRAAPVGQPLRLPCLPALHLPPPRQAERLPYNFPSRTRAGPCRATAPVALPTHLHFPLPGRRSACPTISPLAHALALVGQPLRLPCLPALHLPRLPGRRSACPTISPLAHTLAPVGQPLRLPSLPLANHNHSAN